MAGKCASVFTVNGLNLQHSCIFSTGSWALNGGHIEVPHSNETKRLLRKWQFVLLFYVTAANKFLKFKFRYQFVKILQSAHSLLQFILRQLYRMRNIRQHTKCSNLNCAQGTSFLNVHEIGEGVLHNNTQNSHRRSLQFVQIIAACLKNPF
jgi:hypothetical protein